LALQKQVARSIAEQIKVQLTPREEASLKSVRSVNPEAYESYLKGRYFWNKRTADGLKVALAYFNQAIDEEPKYAQAYSGLADTYALLGDWQYAVMTPKEALPKAKAAALKALELDENLSEAHTSLAFCLEGFDWNWDAAEKEFQRAIELNPGYATAHHWYAWHLSLLGRNSEAIGEMRKAENMDPLSLIINADLAELLAIAHFPDESIQQSRKTIEMDPGFALAHNQLAQAYLEKHMFGEAITELQKAIAEAGCREAGSVYFPQVFADGLGHLKHIQSGLSEDRLQLFISHDLAAFFRVLQFVFLDVGPHLLRDLRSRDGRG
jgi:tetratricopeptide (TPR) repeat protein